MVHHSLIVVNHRGGVVQLFSAPAARLGEEPHARAAGDRHSVERCRGVRGSAAEIVDVQLRMGCGKEAGVEIDERFGHET